MSIAIEPKKTDGAQRYIQVTIPVAMVNEAKQAAARKLASRVAIPGFRPGKAPTAMVLKRYADSIKAEGYVERRSSMTVLLYSSSCFSPSGV